MSKYVTLSSSVPIYNKLLDHIESLLDEKDEKYCEIPKIWDAIQIGYEKLKSYYSKTDDSYAYTIATSNFFNYFFFVFNIKFIIFNNFFLIYYPVLDPRLKLNFYIKEKWEPEFIDQAKNIFINTYNNDYFETNNMINNDDENIINDTDDFFNEIFRTDDNINSNNHEFEDYLNKPVKHAKMEPLKWWKVNNKLLLHLFLTFILLTFNII